MSARCARSPGQGWCGLKPNFCPKCCRAIAAPALSLTLFGLWWKVVAPVSDPVKPQCLPHAQLLPRAARPGIRDSRHHQSANLALLCPRCGPQPPAPERGVGQAPLLQLFLTAPQPAAESGEHHREHGITLGALCKPQPLGLPEPQRTPGTSERVNTWRTRKGQEGKLSHSSSIPWREVWHFVLGSQMQH